MNALNNDCVDKPNDLQRISRSTYAVFPYDGQWLFAERLHDLIGENAEQKAALDKAKDTLKKFLEATVGKSIKPTPYYALLLADGDGMGKAIDNQTSPKEHRQLSQQLAMFAQSAKAIIETTHKGSLVYAGGDDVLAFVPLHTVLACALN